MRRILFLGLFCACTAQAHIGSPDLYLDAKAGPYQLFVTIRPPLVIPGVAEIEVRASGSQLRDLRAVPMPMSGVGAKYSPIPEELAASKEDPQLFTGSLWLMQPGSWQVRLIADGAEGGGKISIPLPSAALRTKRMQGGLGFVLGALGLLLVTGVAAMVGAAVRESRLEPGAMPTQDRIRAGRLASLLTLVGAIAVVWFGNRWWTQEAISYGEEVYKPLAMSAVFETPSSLMLHLSDPGWLNSKGWETIFTRSVDDFIPDHGHLMHLYMIRQPGMDVVFHLHPEVVDPGVFRLHLPEVPAGNYNLYADVVHQNGFPETLSTSVNLGSIHGRPLSGDDAKGIATPWQQAIATSTEFTLPDGYKMMWLRPNGGFRARQATLFHFRLEKPTGSAPDDMAFYMGMLGHAAFVKTDGSVFAHVHPSGSVSMAALMLAQNQISPASEMEGMDMSEQHAALPNEVSIPYGFPSAGVYRILIQMKHGNTVETAFFDTKVAD
jgi:hypothetical protein